MARKILSQSKFREKKMEMGNKNGKKDMRHVSIP